MSLLLHTRLLVCLFTLIGLESVAQTNPGKSNQLKLLIESKKYQFKARSATSMRGKTVQLDPGYFLKINGDSLLVDLPYYGRSSTADYPATDISVQFNSTHFSYKEDSTKKGGWDITIQPNNESKANKITLSVTSSGSCIVNISSNTRQAISYYGSITNYN
jgi:hypothetical protein